MPCVRAASWLHLTTVVDTTSKLRPTGQARPHVARTPKRCSKSLTALAGNLRDSTPRHRLPCQQPHENEPRFGVKARALGAHAVQLHIWGTSLWARAAVRS